MNPSQRDKYIEANKKLAEEQKKAKDTKIPFTFLTALKGATDGESVLRGRKKSSK